VKTRTFLVATGVASLCSIAVAVQRWRGALPPLDVSSSSVPGLRSHRAPSTDDSLALAEDMVVSNDPFRLANHASTVRYDPSSDHEAAGVGGAGATIPAPHPVLVLKAIAGGPPWQAVIDGIPGQSPGTVAQPGMRFDKLTVRVVTRDSVVIQGTDTIWVLSFRKRL
jgi:hypothetical protein